MEGIFPSIKQQCVLETSCVSDKHINVLCRKLAEPELFMESIAKRINCCFNLFDLAAIKKLYQARLDVWAIKYTKQSELVFNTFQSYYIQADQSCVPVVHGSKLCQKCYVAMLGISTKRYEKWLKEWLASGKTLKRVESRHALSVRPAFMKGEIESYLVDLKRLTTIHKHLIIYTLVYTMHGIHDKYQKSISFRIIYIPVM